MSNNMKTNKYKRYESFETLERVKRWPQLLKRFSKVRIYSAEHMAYWRGTGQGYTLDKSESALWDFEDAFKRTNHCCPQKRIQFEKDN